MRRSAGMIKAAHISTAQRGITTGSTLSTTGPTTQVEAGVSVETLETMKMVELREVLRSLGGRPGTLRKLELVEKCVELMHPEIAAGEEASSSGVVEAASSMSVVVEGLVSSSSAVPTPSVPRRGRAKTLPPLDAAVPAVFNASYAVHSTPTPITSAQSSRDRDRDRPRFPYGPLRESRLSQFKAGYASMELTFLGTASCIPSITRGVNCIALRYNADSWLFDCGEASQIQLQKSRVRVSKIKKIFITHNHGDHSFGIPGMLCLMGQATQLERNSRPEERPAPIEIYGPEGVRDMIRAMIQLTYSRITIPHVIHELKEVPFLHGRVMRAPPPPMVRTRADPYYGEVPGSKDFYPDEHGHYRLFEDEELVVTAAPMQHTVPCVGYVVQEKDRVGRLRLDTVKDTVERNLEGLRTQFRNPLKVYAHLKQLQPEERFVFPDGTVVRAEEVVEPARRGRKVVIMGDTCSGERIASLAAGADVLVHESTNAYIKEIDSVRYPDYRMLERDTYMHGHSTPLMAGQFARSIGAKRLLLTHFSPRYRGDESEASMRIMWQVEDQARAASRLAGDNDVVAAWDLMVYPVHSDVSEEAPDDIEADNTTTVLQLESSVSQ